MARAHLTREQQRRYEQLFAIAADDRKYDFNDDTKEEEVSARADVEAWQGLVEEWPDLSEYDGADN